MLLTIVESPVYLLFTDLEQSTRLWQLYPETFPDLLARHNRLLHEVITQHGGSLLKHTGDGVLALFPTPPFEAALEIQVRAHRELHLEDDRPLRLRIAVHRGPVTPQRFTFGQREDVFGPAVNLAARLLHVGHGGQILATEAALPEPLPPPFSTVDLGEHWLRDILHPLRILQITHPQLPIQTFPPLKTLSTPQHNLPVFISPFVGRASELEQLHTWLVHTSLRLVTLTGMGGIGKTRLAVETALRLAPAFPGGVVYVPLEDLTSGDALVHTLLAHLGLPTTGDRPEATLVNHLRHREALIILDNAEHVVDALASLLRRLLDHTQGPRFLVTSRERLRLRDEQVLPLEGMALESTSNRPADAVALFQIQARDAAFLSAEDTRWIHRICQQLDGHPLAIELAARMVHTLSLPELSRVVQREQRALEHRDRDAPARHRNLEAVFLSSWDLLTPEEQRVLRRLSLFRSPHPYARLQQVSDATPATVAALRDKSLLRGVGRHYRIPPLLRGYAEAMLLPEERADTERRYARAILEAVLEQEETFWGPAYRQALDVLHRMLPDLDAALPLALRHGLHARLLDALRLLDRFFVHSRHTRKGYRLFQRLVQDVAPDRHPRLYARLRITLGNLADLLGESEHTPAHLQAAERVLPPDDPRGRFTLSLTWSIYWQMRDLEKTRTYAIRSLRDRLRYGEGREQAAAWNLLGSWAAFTGRFRHAVRYYRKALALLETSPYALLRIMILQNLARALELQGIYPEADRVLDEVEARARREKDLWMLVSALNTRGNVARGMGDLPLAERYYRESAEIAQLIGAPIRRLVAVINLVDVATLREDPSLARTYMDEARDLLHRHPQPVAAIYLRIAEGRIALLEDRPSLALTFFREALQDATHTRYAQGILLARIGLAETHLRQGEVARARRYLRDALLPSHPGGLWEARESGLRIWAEHLLRTGHRAAARGIARHLLADPRTSRLTRARLRAWDSVEPYA